MVEVDIRSSVERELVVCWNRVLARLLDYGARTGGARAGSRMSNG
jgi:hypothetical protein